MTMPILRPVLDRISDYQPAGGLYSAHPPRPLSANESPYGPSPAVSDALTATGRSAHRYPDPGCATLIAELARTHHIAENRILAGAGSIALLQAVFQAVAEPGAEAIFAWPSFELYPVLAKLAGVRPVPVPLTGHAHDLDAMAARITARTRLVVVCDPNNPTGTTAPRPHLDAFLRRVPPSCLVAVDQAYAEYVRTDDGIPPVTMPHPHVVVLRTFSKAYGLAGLRVGYLTGDHTVVTRLRKAVLPYSVSSAAQAAAVTTLRQPGPMTAVTEAVVAERSRVRAELIRAGWTIPPSQANFVWLPLGEDAARFARWCAGQGIAVRAFDNQGVRVTIGAATDNDWFLAAATAWSAIHRRTVTA